MAAMTGLGLGLGLVALGPGPAPGFVLSCDMVFAPDPAPGARPWPRPQGSRSPRSGR